MELPIYQVDAFADAIFKGNPAAILPLEEWLDDATLQAIATAPGDNCDFVSRFFGPQVGIDEDPVTGSAHCSLIPGHPDGPTFEYAQSNFLWTMGGKPMAVA